MPARRQAQVNVRSDALKQRVDYVTARTGMSATRFLEEAAARFDPEPEVLPPGLKRVGWLLVAEAAPGAPVVTMEDTLRWIEDDRNARGEIRP